MDFAHVYLLTLTILGVYMAALSLMTTQVSYPLYTAVPAEAFIGYHERYNRRIAPVIVAPGLPTFAACVAFAPLRPDTVPPWLALLVALGGATALLATALAAIPSHLRLRREGLTPRPYRTLRTADAARTLGCVLSAGALIAALLTSFTPR
jgi:ABC-type proline/glycine betaine transport system permease subunit